MITGVFFDYGETLIEKVVDDVHPLTELPLKAYGDSVAAVRQLKNAGYRMALVSNTCQSNERIVDQTLATLGLRPYFDAIVTSVDVGQRKPEPAMFRRALELLGCSADQVVMVGDDLVNDIQGAAALGIATIHLRRPERTFGPCAVPPRFTVSTLLDVPGILEQLRAVDPRSRP